MCIVIVVGSEQPTSVHSPDSLCMFRGPRHPSIPAGDNPAGRTRSRRPNLNDSIGRRRYASVQPEMERDIVSPGGGASLHVSPYPLQSVAGAGPGPSSALVARTPPPTRPPQDVRQAGPPLPQPLGGEGEGLPQVLQAQRSSQENLEGVLVEGQQQEAFEPNGGGNFFDPPPQQPEPRRTSQGSQFGSVSTPSPTSGRRSSRPVRFNQQQAQYYEQLRDQRQDEADRAEQSLQVTAERDQLLLQVEQLRAEQQRLTAANLRVRNEAQAGLDQRHVHFNRDTDHQQVRMVPPPLRGPFQPRGQPQPGASQFVQGALPQPASTSAGFPSSVMVNPVRQSIGGALAGAATAAVPVQQQMQLQATTRTVASHQYRQPPPPTSANLSAPGTWEQRSRYGSAYQPTIPVSNNDWQWDASQQQPRMQLPQQQPRMQLQVQAALPAISASPVYAANLARVNSAAGASGAAQQQRAQRNLNDDWQYQETLQLSAEEHQMAQLNASIAARKVNLGIQNVDPSGAAASGLPGMAGVNVQQSDYNQFAALYNQFVTPQQQLQSGMQQYAPQPLHSTLTTGVQALQAHPTWNGSTQAVSGFGEYAGHARRSRDSGEETTESGDRHEAEERIRDHQRKSEGFEEQDSWKYEV